MNKILFYTVLIFLALTITLTAVYFLNTGNINQVPASTDTRVSEQAESPGEEFNNSEDTGSEFVVEEISDTSETVPDNFKDPELIDLVKELNSLDLSSENDIE